jgi:hypothetical protein
MTILIEFLIITVKNIPSNLKKLFTNVESWGKTAYLCPTGEEFFQEVKLIQQIKNTGNIKFYRDVKDKHVVTIITVQET